MSLTVRPVFDPSLPLIMTILRQRRGQSTPLNIFENGHAVQFDGSPHFLSSALILCQVAPLSLPSPLPRAIVETNFVRANIAVTKIVGNKPTGTGYVTSPMKGPEADF